MDLSIALILVQDGVVNGAVYALLGLALVLVMTGAAFAQAQLPPPKLPAGAAASPATLPKIKARVGKNGGETPESKGTAVLPKKPGGLPPPTIPGARLHTQYLAIGVSRRVSGSSSSNACAIRSESAVAAALSIARSASTAAMAMASVLV